MMNQMWHFQAACGFGDACDGLSEKQCEEVTDACFSVCPLSSYCPPGT